MSTTQQELLAMWADVFRKTTQAPTTSAFPNLPVTISIVFDGAGAILKPGMAGLIEITFPCQIISAHIYAGDSLLTPKAATASIDLRLSTFNQYGSGGSASLAGGSVSITNSSKTDIGVGGWINQIDPGDVIEYRLESFTGTATWLALEIGARRLDAPLANQAVVTASGTTLVDSSGNTLQFRTLV